MLAYFSMSTEKEAGEGVPRSVLLFRHGYSDYLVSKGVRVATASYQELLKGLEMETPPTNLRELAEQIDKEFPPLYTDDDTPLAPGSVEQLRIYGAVLSKRHQQGQLELPGVIFVSPSKRTRETFLAYISGFPELAEKIQFGGIPIIEDPRIKEKNYGDASLHSDRVVFFGLYPEVVKESKRLGKRAPFEQRFSGGGQNIPDKMAQMKEWDVYLSKEYAGKNVWAFTHHLAIISYRLVKEGFDGSTEDSAVAERFLDLDCHESPPPGSVTIFEKEIANDCKGEEKERLALRRANEIPS